MTVDVEGVNVPLITKGVPLPARFNVCVLKSSVLDAPTVKTLFTVVVPASVLVPPVAVCKLLYVNAVIFCAPEPL